MRAPGSGRHFVPRVPPPPAPRANEGDASLGASDGARRVTTYVLPSPQAAQVCNRSAVPASQAPQTVRMAAEGVDSVVWCAEVRAASLAWGQAEKEVP